MFFDFRLYFFIEEWLLQLFYGAAVRRRNPEKPEQTVSGCSKKYYFSNSFSICSDNNGISCFFRDTMSRRI